MYLHCEDIQCVHVGSQAPYMCVCGVGCGGYGGRGLAKNSGAPERILLWAPHPTGTFVGLIQLCP